MQKPLQRVRWLVPLFVVLCLAYLDYASCYSVAYKEYYLHRSRAAAVVFWVLAAIFQITLLAYWIAIYAQGPGSVPELPHLDIYGTRSPETQPLPHAFVCDEQGYPFWCSKSQKLKPDRSFYSKHIQSLVPKFDHFCLWIGTAIGRANYLSFLKFLQWGLAYVITVVIFCAVAIRPAMRRGNVSVAQYIVVFALCGFGLAFGSSLYIMAILNMNANTTTLDGMTEKSARSYKRWTEKRAKLSPKRAWLAGKMPRQESGVRHINVAHNGSRVVVPYSVHDQPYSLGFRRNLINTCLKGNYSRNDTAGSTSEFCKALAVFFLPFVDLFCSHDAKDALLESHSDDFSPRFLESIERKIDRKSFKMPSYCQTSLDQGSSPTGSPKVESQCINPNS